MEVVTTPSSLRGKEARGGGESVSREETTSKKEETHISPARNELKGVRFSHVALVDVKELHPGEVNDSLEGLADSELEVVQLFLLVLEPKEPGSPRNGLASSLKEPRVHPFE